MKVSISFVLAASCLLFCTQGLAAGKVYKWTDKKGVLHYEQQPPTNTAAEVEVIKPQTAHSDPSPSQIAPAAQPATEAAPGKKVDPLLDPERCENARKNVETLKTYSHIRIKGDDGQYRYLTPDEQKQKLDEANLAVKQSCAN